MQITLNRRVLLPFVFLFVVYAIYIIIITAADRPINFNSAPKIDFYRDWNDYKFMEYEASRSGPGEHGVAVHLDDQKEIEMNEKLLAKTGFSAVVSDKISLNRSLPKLVHQDCLDVKYLAELPKTSVIIIFYNEVLSVLLRTVHSVYNRTPKELLHEIILVNDHSSNVDDYKELSGYLAANFQGTKAKVKELTKRSGLIRARMEGAREATGEVLVFFDSHVEVQNNWLPPLLEPIVKNRKIATLPIVDYFDCRTFEFYPEQEFRQGTRGVIDWFLNFHELDKLTEDMEHSLRPFPNPIMLGCAFAIDRKFFLDELGGYDEELQIWNGENYELSFKLWMCRDGLFTVPCSRVGHSFRDINPSRKSEVDFVAKNFKRLAEVWLDEFKDLLYEREPERYKNLDPGDLTRPKMIRNRLGCKPYRWFLKNVAPDMVIKYPPILHEPVFASGAIKSAANPRLCLDNLGKLFEDRIGVYECDENLKEPRENQRFTYSFYKDLRQTINKHEYCLDAYNLNLIECNELEGGNQFWLYDLTSKQIKTVTDPHAVAFSKCITLNLQKETIDLEKCTEDDTQKWYFGYVNYTAFKKFDQTFGYADIVNELNL